MAVQVVVAAQEGVERLWEKQASTGMRTGTERRSLCMRCMDDEWLWWLHHDAGGCITTVMAAALTVMLSGQRSWKIVWTWHPEIVSDNIPEGKNLKAGETLPTSIEERRHIGLKKP
eukprot:1157969-Pelagomonas_calceolata.AAC.2